MFPPEKAVELITIADTCDDEVVVYYTLFKDGTFLKQKHRKTEVDGWVTISPAHSRSTVP